MISNWILKLWNISALLDSTHHKVSNGILFVIFGSMKQKIWILQDSIEIWSKFLFWFSFKPGVTTCRVLIGSYRFSWISIVKRQILRRSDGLDRPVPLHLSEVFRSFGSWSDDQDETDGEVGSPRVPTRDSLVRACWNQAPARLQGLLDNGDGMTKIGMVRRSRKHDSPRRSRPEKRKKCGWRRAGRRCASGDDEHVDSLRNWANQEVRGCARSR
jgi:hypothetical protein